MIEYLRECGRLLKWVFFQPSKLRAHIRQIAPDESYKRGFSYQLELIRTNSAYRKLQSQTFVVNVAVLVFLNLLIGSIITISGVYYYWAESWEAIVVGIAVGIAGNIAGVVGTNVAFGVVHGVGISAGMGVTGGIALGVMVGGGWVSVALGIVIGVTVGIASGVIFDVMGGTLFGIMFGALFGATGGVAGGTAGGIAGFLAGTRFLFYVFEIWPAIKTYRRSLTSQSPDDEFLSSPVCYDEGLVWPQPYLSSFLLRVYEMDSGKGLKLIGKVACMPFQRWAAQTALRTLLEDQKRSFFIVLDQLLSSPEPYTATGFDSDEREREADKYFSTKLLLAELTDKWPKPESDTDDYWPNDRLPRILTFWLRKKGRSEYSELAEIWRLLLDFSSELAKTNRLLKLLNDIENTDRIKLNLPQKVSEVKEKATNSKVKVIASVIRYSTKLLKHFRHLPHAEEFYQSMRLIELGWQCDGTPQVAKMLDEFKPILEITSPLRPQIITVFRRLRDAAQDASAFLTGEHELTRRDALLKAGGVLEEARRLANEVYEPERSLLLAVIERWRRMFAIEGGRVTEQREVEVLPNPYVAGRPIRPEDGRLFVGRRYEFRSIEEKLQTGVGLVVWGQRRIGKTSMLLHLPGHLSHDLLPVYLNLQMLMANSTGAFLHAVGKAIIRELRGKIHVRNSAFRRPDSDAETLPPEGGTTNALAEALLSAEEFERQPYLSFNHLLEEIEPQLQPGQRVVLSFDEFEELEQRVKDGKIEKEIFAYLRGVTQTGRGFALLFAGLHTLEQMTREYWNPFFASVQTIRVSYLSELDAEQLITDPLEQFPLSYEYEAIKRITELTRSHAYLTQSLCHNLVNRLNDPLHRSQKAKREDVDAVVERTLESSGYYFDDFVWGWSKENERIALSLLAEVEGEAAFSVVEKHLGREAALEATRKLVGRDILSERTSETGELVFRFQIPLARMWVQRMKPSARILMEGGRL